MSLPNLILCPVRKTRALKAIHVGKAEASRDSDATKVFIELRDVNYPGSTYTLDYEPANDQLKGVYYQGREIGLPRGVRTDEASPCAIRPCITLLASVLDQRPIYRRFTFR